jgi:hypothetical protein
MLKKVILRAPGLVVVVVMVVMLVTAVTVVVIGGHGLWWWRCKSERVQLGSCAHPIIIIYRGHDHGIAEDFRFR